MKEYKVIYKNRDYTVKATSVIFQFGVVLFHETTTESSSVVAIFPLESIVIEKGHGDIN